MRTAILPFPGDPYLLNYWINIFKRIWYDEIDKLIVFHNSTIEPEMEQYIKNLCNDEKIVYIYKDKQIEHGECINQALDYTTDDDIIMLIEDDGYIFKSGKIDYCFKAIESGNYDIVGSKRGSCAFEILEAAKKKWGLDYQGLGDQGCNFWPCYFFAKSSLLKKTSRNFGANAFYKGKYITPINYTVEPDVIYSDTFVYTSLELRDMIPENRILYVNQYHANPEDIVYAENRVNLFDGNSYWTHIGSLSSGVGGVLRDRENRPLVKRKIEPPKGETILEKYANTDMEKMEWARRISFWLKFWEYASNNKGNEEFYILYGEAVNRIINQYGLHIKTIRKFQNAYSILGL